jgi:PhnB protein
MNSAYKPDHYTSVAPYLIVTDAGATIQFLTEIFGGSELRKFTAPDGRIVHAEFKVDDTVIMLAQGSGAFPAVPAHVHIYVSDVDSVYARAIAYGAVSIQKPVQQGDEDKRGGIKDTGGTTWWIATRVGG